MNPHFDFCFEGIEKESVVAVSTYMASEHDNRCDQKEWVHGRATTKCCGILSRKKSSVTIHRFPEMQGNLIYVDYERSSWRYLNYERSFPKRRVDAFKMDGAPIGNRDTIEPYLIGKGGRQRIRRSVETV